jgi:hypothetical protein
VLAIKVSCATIAFVATAFTIYTVGPALETRFWPAVSKLQILSLETDDSGQAVVMTEFTKLRGECEYVGIAWFKGRPDGNFERVPVILQRRDGDTSSPNRPPGTQRAGPWIIGMTPAELRTGSFAKLTHRCHPLWVTTTDFWP